MLRSQFRRVLTAPRVRPAPAAVSAMPHGTSMAATMTSSSASPVAAVARRFYDDPSFEKYSEIDNATLGRVQAIRGSTAGDDWIATEKVHGANFGIYVLKGGRAVRYAKRSGYIGDNETFFGYLAIVPELQAHGLAAHKAVCEILDQPVDTVIINGELFGGKFLHPNVPRSTQTFQHSGSIRGISSVQREPFPQYHPDLKFYAFDVKYRVAEDAPPVHLTFDQAQEVFKKCPGLLYQRILMRGPLDKIVAFNVETFNTTVPSLIGQADNYLLNNRAEGIVVRHAKRGSAELEGKTTMLKIKSTAFSEMHMRANVKDPMADARAMAIERAGPQLPMMSGVLPTDKDVEKCEALCDHVCDSRLANVMSKIGPDPFNDGTMSQDRLGFMLAQDSLKDFLKDGDSETPNLPIMVRREFARYVLTAAKKLVAAKWDGILQDMAAEAEGSTA